jgi:hypothetical protein
MGQRVENFTSIPLEGIRDDKVSYPVDGRMNVCWSWWDEIIKSGNPRGVPYSRVLPIANFCA